MKIIIVTIALLVPFLGVQAQLKVATDGKVAVGGAATTYGGFQMNKDGYANGIAFSQATNYGTHPFRIFRDGMTGYITMDNVTDHYCGFKMSSNGHIAMGGLSNGWNTGSQLNVFGNNVCALATRFDYPPNNFGDALKSSVLQPNNVSFAGWYMPMGGTFVKTFYVTGNGNLYCYGHPIDLSDASIKSDIKSIESPLDVIKKLNGVTYKNEFRAGVKKDYYNSITEDGKRLVSMDSTYDQAFVDALMAEYDKRDMGLVAQDVEKILPDVVYKMGAEKKGIAYTQLIALLIEGIKEQQQEIETLNETITAIQNAVASKIDVLSSDALKVIASANTIKTTNTPVLEQNAPNPFNTSTEIRYYIPGQVRQATLYVFNMQGTLLRTSPLGDKGHGLITINASELKAGMYLYSLVIDGKKGGYQVDDINGIGKAGV